MPITRGSISWVYGTPRRQSPTPASQSARSFHSPMRHRKATLKRHPRRAYPYVDEADELLGVFIEESDEIVAALSQHVERCRQNIIRSCRLNRDPAQLSHPQG